MSTNADLQLGALDFVHKGVRDQLAILRQTRGQREVGTVKIPAHLAQPDVVTIAGDRIAARIDPRACSGCGRGLRQGEVGTCASCASNPTSDAGVELRQDRAAVLPAR
jgi:hypothetical protein